MVGLTCFPINPLHLVNSTLVSKRENVRPCEGDKWRRSGQHNSRRDDCCRRASEGIAPWAPIMVVSLDGGACTPLVNLYDNGKKISRMKFFLKKLGFIFENLK